MGPSSMIESTGVRIRERLVALTLAGASYAMQESNQRALHEMLDHQIDQAWGIAEGARVAAIRTFPGFIGMCAADARRLFGHRSLSSLQREALEDWELAEDLLTQYLLARFTIGLPGPQLAKLYALTVRAR